MTDQFDNNSENPLDVKEPYDNLRLPIGEGTTFMALGYANVPLHQNWAKKAFQKTSTSFFPGYGDHSKDTYGGWTWNCQKPGPPRIAYCCDLGGLSEPNNEPLDAMTLQGIHIKEARVMSDMATSQQTKERTQLQFIPLVLHYDLDADLSWPNTTAWISTQISFDQQRTLNHTKFVKVDIGKYFDQESLQKRFRRFRAQLKKTFA